jgi:hypothetical protein
MALSRLCLQHHKVADGEIMGLPLYSRQQQILSALRVKLAAP